MPEINISKKDVLWGYVATFFQVASGLVVLPFILHFLTKEEVGLNYIMLTVGAMVSLFDFGFTPQFGRNFSYIFSGATDLAKEGLQNAVGEKTNYRLLRIL
ncbi:MAG: polysaccharide biosynthesis protein, partial [Bacteroidales bacterium]|nr:polysaccharide biosynthesis protein [Bacteroidales bacterium]